jgi:hypothetical protein
MPAAVVTQKDVEVALVSAPLAEELTIWPYFARIESSSCATCSLLSSLSALEHNSRRVWGSRARYLPLA